MLKRRTFPSAVAMAFNELAEADGLPSDDSPSVTFITMGGKEAGFIATHAVTISFAFQRAWHIGVPPLATASNHTGNLIFCSMKPPAPSSTFFVRSSTRAGVFAISLIGTRSLPDI